MYLSAPKQGGSLSMTQITAGNVVFWADVRQQRDGDGGPSIQVRTTVDGEEVQLLRFDCFRIKPHYHYTPQGQNVQYNIDPTMIEDSLGWTLSQLRSKLGELVVRAGYPAVAEGLDAAAVASGLAEIEAHLRAEVLSAAGR
jgi:hypothetical protein